MFTEAVDNFVDNPGSPTGTRGSVRLLSKLPIEWAMKRDIF
jgi:hypothetical protein